MDEIKIAYDMEDIEKKSDSEKLTLLLKIAFESYETLESHSKILFGNGEQGLCDTARFNKLAIKGLWAVFITAVLGFAGVLFTHLSK
jgi:hypothetical protein